MEDVKHVTLLHLSVAPASILIEQTSASSGVHAPHKNLTISTVFYSSRCNINSILHAAVWRPFTEQGCYAYLIMESSIRSTVVKLIMHHIANMLWALNGLYGLSCMEWLNGCVSIKPKRDMPGIATV
ncbi:hypothetical protein FKM82_010063 [Ascaphus truei]